MVVVAAELCELEVGKDFFFQIRYRPESVIVIGGGTMNEKKKLQIKARNRMTNNGHQMDM